jgi:NgoFVII restriction endonuclease
MFTNLAAFGGDFLTVLDSEFKKALNVTVASGYASLDIINAYNSEFIRIANSGGSSRLLLGMAFYEGLSQKKYDALIELNSALRNCGNDSGVYVTNGRRYHGKVYYNPNQIFMSDLLTFLQVVQKPTLSVLYLLQFLSNEKRLLGFCKSYIHRNMP